MTTTFQGNHFSMPVMCFYKLNGINLIRAVQRNDDDDDDDDDDAENFFLFVLYFFFDMLKQD